MTQFKHRCKLLRCFCKQFASIRQKAILNTADVKFAFSIINGCLYIFMIILLMSLLQQADAYSLHALLLSSAALLSDGTSLYQVLTVIMILIMNRIFISTLIYPQVQYMYIVLSVIKEMLGIFCLAFILHLVYCIVMQTFLAIISKL